MFGKFYRHGRDRGRCRERGHGKGMVVVVVVLVVVVMVAVVVVVVVVVVGHPLPRPSPPSLVNCIPFPSVSGGRQFHSVVAVVVVWWCSSGLFKSNIIDHGVQAVGYTKDYWIVRVGEQDGVTLFRETRDESGERREKREERDGREEMEWVRHR